MKLSNYEKEKIEKLFYNGKEYFSIQLFRNNDKYMIEIVKQGDKFRISIYKRISANIYENVMNDFIKADNPQDIIKSLQQLDYRY